MQDTTGGIEHNIVPNPVSISNPLVHTTSSRAGSLGRPRHIHDLPGEILCLIFEILRTSRIYPIDAKSHLYNVIRVCRRWHILGLPFLWKSIYLPSYPDSDTPYGDRLSVTLDSCSSVWLNLNYVRRLRLRFYNNHDLISSVEQCEGILQRMGRLNHVFQASSSVTSLWVRFDPFIPSDCENPDLWPIVRQANEIMQEVAQTIRERSTDLEQLEVSLGREEYRYEERSREEVNRLFRHLLGSSITDLLLFESSLEQVNKWLEGMNQLRHLQLALHANDLEERSTALSQFWYHVDRIGMESLDLSGGFPLMYLSPNWSLLQRINISHVDSSLDAAQLFYTHMPYLKVCAINRSVDRNLDTSEIPEFQGEVLSTSLRTVTFMESVAPVGLLQKIARRCRSSLEVMVFPRNGANEDLQTVVLMAPGLRRISLGHCLSMTQSGIAVVSGAQYLTSLEFHWSHLNLLTQDLILALEKNCRFLDQFVILTYHNRASRARRLAIKQLHSKAFRKWLHNFISVDTSTFSVIIHLEWLRKFNEWKEQSNPPDKCDSSREECNMIVDIVAST